MLSVMCVYKCIVIFKILCRLGISFLAEKCLLQHLDDPRLPKLKVTGKLPFIHLDIVDTRYFKFVAILLPFQYKLWRVIACRLVSMASVLNSMPPLHYPETKSEMPNSKLQLARSISFIDNESALENLENAFRDASNKGQIFAQVTKVFLVFEFQEMKASLSVAEADNTFAKQIVNFTMSNLTIKCENKTFENDVQVTLKQINLKYVDRLNKAALLQSREQEHQLTLIKSETKDLDNELLVSVRFLAVGKESPELSVRHKSVLNKLNVAISGLTCYFHREAVIDLMQFSDGIKTQIGFFDPPVTSETAQSPLPVFINLPLPGNGKFLMK